MSGAPDEIGNRRGLFHGEARGAFKLVFKISGAWGGYEATCPFHRGTETAAKCKKFIPMRHALDHDVCMSRHKGWCLAAQHLSRKGSELRFAPAVAGHDAAMLEVCRIDERPPWDTIMSDAFLDEVEPADPNSPRNSRGNRPGSSRDGAV